MSIHEKAQHSRHLHSFFSPTTATTTDIPIIIIIINCCLLERLVVNNKHRHYYINRREGDGTLHACMDAWMRYEVQSPGGLQEEDTHPQRTVHTHKHTRTPSHCPLGEAAAIANAAGDEMSPPDEMC